MNDRLKTWLRILAFVGFIISLCIGVYFHEIWRDEARALSIVRTAQSIFELPQLLNNEGHPILWYALLYIGFNLSHSPLVLPILSSIFACGFAYLLIFKSPFPLLINILIAFGFWGLYEYGINCRNYGIAAFLFLLYAHFKSKSEHLNIQSAITLALSMHCNFYSSVFAFFLAAESFIRLHKWKKIHYYILVLLLSSFAFSIYTILPDGSSNVYTGHQITTKNLFSIWDVGYGFNQVFYTPFHYKHGFVTWVLLLSLLPFQKKPWSLFFLILSLLFMSGFGTMMRSNFIHHMGMWFYYFLVQLWLHYETISTEVFQSKLNYKSILSKLGVIAFLFICLSNTYRGIDFFWMDIKMDKSDAPYVAEYLSRVSTQDDIWIAEPDYILEPVMYYNYHPYYLPREKRIKSYVHFTKENDSLLNLSQILDAAEQFNRKTFLLFEHKIHSNDSCYKYSMKQFNLDSLGKQRVLRDYHLLDSFNRNYFTDEHYFVYTKKESSRVKSR